MRGIGALAPLGAVPQAGGPVREQPIKAQAPAVDAERQRLCVQREPVVVARLCRIKAAARRRTHEGERTKANTPQDCSCGVFWNKSLTITYFHRRPSTIIGAEAFHCPVRDGKEWDHLAMVVRRNLLPCTGWGTQPIGVEAPWLPLAVTRRIYVCSYSLSL